MKQILLRTFLPLSCLVSCLVPLLAATPSFAEGKQLTFDIETSITPLSGMGLIMDSTGTHTFTDIELSTPKTNTVRAKFTVPDGSAGKDALASVVVFASDGATAFSTVRSLQSITLPKLPECPKKEAVMLTDQNQVGVLQSLVTIRSDRRDTARAKVLQQLNPDYLERLKKLEKGFGLPSEPALSGDLPPVVLVDRLNRILNAVRNYRSNKKS